MESYKDYGHFDYPTPFNKELVELGLVPYRTNSPLKRKIDYIFRHIHNPHRQDFIDISTSGDRKLVEDMATRAVALVRHFLLYPQQYGHKLENIHLQIIVRMWRQMFRQRVMQNKPTDIYYPARMKLVSIENGLLEELIRTVESKDYIQHNDDMVKKRYDKDGKQVPLRGRVGYSEKNLDYYDSLV